MGRFNGMIIALPVCFGGFFSFKWWKKALQEDVDHQVTALPTAAGHSW